MVIRKLMSNLEIYNNANALLTAFADFENIVLPVKVHFYFQKNMDNITEIAKDIEKAREEILRKHGTLSEDGMNFTFPSEIVEEVNKDINDLFTLEQEVKINLIPLSWLESLSLTAKQVNALTFMIDEEEE